MQHRCTTCLPGSPARSATSLHTCLITAAEDKGPPQQKLQLRCIESAHSLTQTAKDSMTTEEALSSNSTYIYSCTCCTHKPRTCCTWPNYPSKIVKQILKGSVDTDSEKQYYEDLVDHPTFRGVKFICPDHPRGHEQQCLDKNEHWWLLELNNNFVNSHMKYPEISYEYLEERHNPENKPF